MAKKACEHPLKTWLAGQEISVPQFAPEAEIPWRTLYDTINGVSPNLNTMLAIETATAGHVSVQAQADWFRARK